MWALKSSKVCNEPWLVRIDTWEPERTTASSTEQCCVKEMQALGTLLPFKTKVPHRGSIKKHDLLGIKFQCAFVSGLKISLYFPSLFTSIQGYSLLKGENLIQRQKFLPGLSYAGFLTKSHMYLILLKESARNLLLCVMRCHWKAA